MKKYTYSQTKIQKELSEIEVNLLLQKVREFQEINQKYLIKITNPISFERKPKIINMANTN